MSKETGFRYVFFILGLFAGFIGSALVAIGASKTYADGLIDARRECHEVKQLTLTVDQNCRIVERVGR